MSIWKSQTFPFPVFLSSGTKLSFRCGKIDFLFPVLRLNVWTSPQTTSFVIMFSWFELFKKTMLVDLTYTSSCSAFSSPSRTFAALTMFAKTFAESLHRPNAMDTSSHFFWYQEFSECSLHSHDFCPSDLGRRLGQFCSIQATAYLPPGSLRCWFFLILVYCSLQDFSNPIAT